MFIIYIILLLKYEIVIFKTYSCVILSLLLQLLDNETQVNLQIPLLLKYQKDDIALKKAVESGNTDLIYMVLLHMQSYMPLGKFQVSLKSNLTLILAYKMF